MFIPLSYKWWYFKGMPKNEARKWYQIIYNNGIVTTAKRRRATAGR